MLYNHKLFNIYYEKYGNKSKTLIILPGWGNNRETFNYLISNLKDYFTIYIFDYPGFGKTKMPKHDLKMIDYATVINDFMDDFNIVNSYIIGHSFGGRIIILLESIYKRTFKKVILIDSAGIKNFSFTKLFRKYLYKFLKKLSFLFKDQKKYQNKLLNYFGSKDLLDIDPFMRNTFISIVNNNLIKNIPHIKSNTLIIWGLNDLETPYSDALKFNRLIKNSYLIPIKDSGHFPYLDYPYHVLSIIMNYLL